MGISAQQEKVIILIVGRWLERDERRADGKGEGSRKSGLQCRADLCCIDDSACSGCVGYRLWGFLQLDKRLPDLVDESLWLALVAPDINDSAGMGCARPSTASIDGGDDIRSRREGRSGEVTLECSLKGSGE